jgi:NAD dependent epimerase/dehydratase family enzyme
VRAMRIVLAGGTGQVGAVLKRAFAGEDVVVLSRSGGVRWDGRTLGPWAAQLEGADALINLAGRSVDSRYTAANRRAIMDSRLECTFVLREAIAQHADDLRGHVRSGGG